MITNAQSLLFKKNLKLLERKDPSLAQRLKNWKSSSGIEIVRSKNGRPVPVVRNVSLHSRYDPEKEARGWVMKERFDQEGSILFGLGMGYHLEALLEKVTHPVSVIEPSLDIFAHFIMERDLALYPEGVQFLIDETPAKAISRLVGVDFNIIRHLPSVRLNESYFEKIKTGLEFLRVSKVNPLRVLIIPPIYGGSLPTARFCFEALEILGHKPFWADCDQLQDAFHSLNSFTGNPAHSKIVSQKFLQFVSEALVAKAAEVRPDLILCLAQAPLDSETAMRLKELGVPLAFWFVEDFRSLTYWEEMAPVYDYFFTIQRGEFHHVLGQKPDVNCYYLPQACHPPTHKKLTVFRETQGYESEVSFMGAPYYNRVQSFVRLLDLPFKIWGEGWDPKSIYGSVLQNDGKRISTEESVKIFNGSKINLNLHSSSFHEGVNPNGDFVNPRTFEIASCEAFQIVDTREELPYLFDTERELVTCSDMASMKDTVEYYLANPEARKEKARAGHRRVVTEHTFVHRMKELLSHIFIKHLPELLQRLEGRREDWEQTVKGQIAGTSLGDYLEQFSEADSFSLEALKAEIESGDGDLSDPELLILMVDQVVK